MDKLQPIMVRTFGRTGSTLLMQILGSSDSVCFERIYPFEHRYLTYVYNMSRIASAKAVNDENWNNDIMFQGKTGTIGSLPYGLIRALDTDSLRHQTFVALWQAFSDNLRQQNGIAPGPAYYAEKAPDPVAEYSITHLDARSIHLLRDPRDEMISIKSFNFKRGFNSFGWQDWDTDTTFATRLCKNRQKFMQLMMTSETTDHAIHVRYEDLILNGKREVARLSDWLGVSMNIKSAMKNKDIKNRHMTAKDPASTVARWKTEMDESVQAIFAENLGRELTSLGYELQ